MTRFVPRALAVDRAEPPDLDGRTAAGSGDAVQDTPRIMPAWPGDRGTTGPHGSEDPAAVRRRFEASVAAHFPPAQAAKLTGLLADRARLEPLPINELVSMTVRN